MKSKIFWFVSAASMILTYSYSFDGCVNKMKLLMSIRYVMILDDILRLCNHFQVTTPIGYLHVSQVQTIQYKMSGQTIIRNFFFNFSKIISKKI